MFQIVTMGKKCRGIRGNWTRSMMEEALELLRKGKSQRYVENHCGIPRRTLRNHLKSGRCERKLGCRKILTTDQEKDLEERIIRFADIGFPLTPLVMRRCVFTFVEKHNIKHRFNKEEKLAGREWFRGFMKRHPRLSRRKSQSLNPARAQKLNPFIVNDYFAKLGTVITQLDLNGRPQNIFNMDEKGIRLTLHHQQNVLALKGAKRVHLVSHEHAENVTAVACVSAMGAVIPPMILFKGKRYRKTFKKGLPPGSKVIMTPKGSMTSEVFVQWLEHFAKFKPAGETLLVMDGAKPHLDISIVDKAEEHSITLFCLPSNTTHELQPLDKAVFRPFEHYWDAELLYWWDRDPEDPDRKLTKDTFSEVFTPVWSKSMTLSNITSSFRATGIYPFDSKVIPEEAFAPSTVTYHEQEESDDDTPLSVRLAALDAKCGNEKVKSPFQEILPTPNKKAKKSSGVPRKKAVNYKAQKLTRNLFAAVPDNDACRNQLEGVTPLHQPSTSSLVPGTSSALSTATTSSLQAGTGTIQTSSVTTTQSWYCAACCEDYQADMRACKKCWVWVHEECVGLTKKDKEDFICC